MPSTKDMLMQHLKARLDALPEDDPRRKVIADMFEEKEAPDVQREALRKLARERFNALPDGDPLREVLGRVLGEEEAAAPPSFAPASPPPSGANAFRADAWEAIRSLEKGQQAVVSAMKTIDARAFAAMQEVQRLSAKAVEMQEFLNLVLEEVGQNTQMLRSFKDTFAPQQE